MQQVGVERQDVAGVAGQLHRACFVGRVQWRVAHRGAVAARHQAGGAVVRAIVVEDRPRASASAARSAASRVAWRVRVTTSTRAWPEAVRNIARACQYVAPSASTRSSVCTVSGQPMLDDRAHTHAATLPPSRTRRLRLPSAGMRPARRRRPGGHMAMAPAHTDPPLRWGPSLKGHVPHAPEHPRRRHPATGPRGQPGAGGARGRQGGDPARGPGTGRPSIRPRWPPTRCTTASGWR